MSAARACYKDGRQSTVDTTKRRTRSWLVAAANDVGFSHLSDRGDGRRADPRLFKVGEHLLPDLVEHGGAASRDVVEADNVPAGRRLQRAPTAARQRREFVGEVGAERVHDGVARPPWEHMGAQAKLFWL